LDAPSKASVGAHQARIQSTNQEFQEFEIPSPESYPAQLAIDDAGIVWLTEYDGNRIGRFDPETADWTEYVIPTPSSKPWGLAVDSTAGFVWFTETAGDKIGRLEMESGLIVEYDLDSNTQQSGALHPTRLPSSANNHRVFLPLIQVAPHEPWDIAIAADGSVWFTEREGNAVGKLMPDTGEITEYTVPTPSARPTGLARWGNWLAFTESMASKIGWLYMPTGTIYEFRLPNQGSEPRDVTMTSAGNAWVTIHDQAGDQIALFRVSTQADWVLYPLNSPTSEPYGITMEGDTAVWFTEQATSHLGRFVGVSPPDEFPLPQQGSHPTAIDVDESGCAWYTAPAINRIGRFCPSGQ
jgi:virginiamycin B lyase